MKYLYLFIVFVISCGVEPSKKQHTTTGTVQAGEGFEAHYAQFKELFDLDPSPVSISMSDEQLGERESVIAICRPNTLEILVERGYWEKAGYFAREQLVFHELGHCLMRLEHSEDLVDFGNPKYVDTEASIMYPSVFGKYSYYRENRRYYVNELKERYELGKDTFLTQQATTKHECNGDH